MSKRFVAIWFRYLRTDWFTLRRSVRCDLPFVLAAPGHGRMLITEATRLAEEQGVHNGMLLADAKAIIPCLQVLDDRPGLSEKLLNGIAEWCIRYTPAVAIDSTDGLILDTTGCAHLWKGEPHYLEDIISRLKNLGYHVRAAMADTIGAAWAIARFGMDSPIIERGTQAAALLSLPPQALRLEYETVERLQKLGLRQVNDFISMPRAALRRRFGHSLLQRLDQALGHEEESMHLVKPVEAYLERLPCLEPIVTARGIEIALEHLLDKLCQRLKQEDKGLRTAVLKGYRVDGKIEKIEIGTNRPSYNTRHLFKLFENKIGSIEPALGIDLFLLEAQKVEDLSPVQEKLWEKNGGLGDTHLSELLDHLACRIGANHIHRYVADEHYWPERSVKLASSLDERSNPGWRVDRPRPLQLLATPEPVDVTAPIPDYPPMLFRYKGKLHKISKADGPERIEQEWWLQEGQHRDYYYVEDEEGRRYWLFRLGHYSEKSYQWFIHGFFA